MNCLNQKCRASKSRVTKSFDDTGTVKRWRSCAKCGAKWTTDERPNPISLTLADTGQDRPKRQHLLPPMATNGQESTGNNQGRVDLEQSGERSAHAGGDLGGGPSSGSSPDPVRNPGPVPSDPKLDRGLRDDRARDPYRFNHLATNTPAFLSVYNRYPNKMGKNVASQVFRELAETYPGGEASLAAAILAAFDRGMLKRRPYYDEERGVRFCPALERFLEKRLWEDEVPGDDDHNPPASGRRVSEYG